MFSSRNKKDISMFWDKKSTLSVAMTSLYPAESVLTGAYSFHMRYASRPAVGVRHHSANLGDLQKEAGHSLLVSAEKFYPLLNCC